MVFEKAYLLFGLAAAMLYAVAASFLKSGGDRGVRGAHSTLLANAVLAAFFLVFLPWSSGDVLPARWWPSIIIGALCFAGQLCTILALKNGHASISTPAMGSKVVLVALLMAFVFHRPLDPNVWVSAGLTTIGILILAWPTDHFPMARVIPGVGFAMLASLAFALFDILTQIWSKELTFGRLMPWSIIFATIFSAVYAAITERELIRIPKEARWHLWLGVCLLATQSTLLVGAIGYFQDAAGLNVVFGSRGIWSVLLVWLLGHHFSAQERIHSKAILVRRLTGSMLIAAAVVLVFC